MAFYLQDFFLCTSLYTAKKSCGILSSLYEFLDKMRKRENLRTSVYAKIFSLLVLGTIYTTNCNFLSTYRLFLMYFIVHCEKVLRHIKLIIQVFINKVSLKKNNPSIKFDTRIILSLLNSF